jgi:putative oxidoreductase
MTFGPLRGRRQADRRDLLAGLGWVSTAFAVTLYLADGTFTTISSLADALHALGVVSGLVATNAMLFMLLLAARVPVIDRAIGQVKAIQWHRQLGQITVLGVLAHALLILAGAAWSHRAGIVGALQTLWSNDMALAAASLGLLLVISVTSVVAVRQKLRYEVWHIIHLLSYLSVILAIPHMFTLGSTLATGTWQRIYWTTLLLAVGTCLLAYRVLVPLYRSWRHDLRLAEVTRISPDVYHLRFTGRHLDELDIEGGQYMTWRLCARGLWSQPHPFSLSKAPSDNELRITIRTVGDGTSQLAAAKPGTRVLFEGPYGVFTDRARTRNGLLLIAAGTGVTPVYSMLESSTADPTLTAVVLRASDPKDLLLLDEFRRLCDERGVALHVMTGPRHEGRWVNAKYAAHNIGSLVGDLNDCDVFVCGPAGFVDAVLEEAAALGLPEEQRHEERFTW